MAPRDQSHFLVPKASVTSLENKFLRLKDYLPGTCFPPGGKGRTEDPENFCGVVIIIVLKTVRLAWRESYGITRTQDFVAVPYGEQNSTGNDIGELDVAGERIELLARPPAGVDGGVNDLETSLMSWCEESFYETCSAKVDGDTVVETDKVLARLRVEQVTNREPQRSAQLEQDSN